MIFYFLASFVTGGKYESLAYLVFLNIGSLRTGFL